MIQLEIQYTFLQLSHSYKIHISLSSALQSEHVFILVFIVVMQEEKKTSLYRENRESQQTVIKYNSITYLLV